MREPTVAADSRIVTNALALAQVPAESSDLAFEGRTGPVPWPKAYGGDMVAQAATAAMRSETTGKRLHSIHSYFLRPVDVAQTIRYEVEVLRDGRGYSARQVRAVQHGKVSYIAMASFAAPETGPVAELSPPSWITESLPRPEDLPSSAESLVDRDGGTMTGESKGYWSTGRGFDMRHVPGPIYLETDGGREPHQGVWLRPFTPLAAVEGLDDLQRDAAALAYVCDYTILEPILRALDIAWADPGLTTASLDHAMWFHRPVPLDDWVLYAQDALDADGGRGLALGRFYTRDLRHIATVTQEGLIRSNPAPDKETR